MADVSTLLLDAAPGSPAVGEAVVKDAAPAARTLLKALSDVQPVSFPGVAPLLASGPLALALGATALRGIAASLADFGVPELEASQYEQKIREGGVLISLCSGNPDQSDRARTIFRSSGAEIIRTIMVVPLRGLLRVNRASEFASSPPHSRPYGRSLMRPRVKTPVAP